MTQANEFVLRTIPNGKKEPENQKTGTQPQSEPMPTEGRVSEPTDSGTSAEVDRDK